MQLVERKHDKRSAMVWPGRMVHSHRTPSVGLDVRTDDSDIIGVIDLRFIGDDILCINPENWPPVGARLKVRRQGTTPNGQIRYTARESELALPATEQEWLDSPAGKAWLADQNNDPGPA